MKLVDEYNILMLNKKDTIMDDTKLKKMLKTIEEYKEKGIISKKSFDLPLLDTLGRVVNNNSTK